MTNFRSYDDLNDSPNRDPFSTLANGLRGLACQAFDTYRDLMLPPPDVASGLFRRAAEPFWDSVLCPPPPGNYPLSYAPGCNVQYQAVRVGNVLRPNGTVFSGANQTINIGTQVVRLTYRVDGRQFAYVITRTSGAVDEIVQNPSTFPTGGTWDITSLAIARADGLPVNTACDVPPVVNPEILFPPIINIDIGGDVFPVEISPVTYNVDGDTYFSPSFNTSLGPVQFDLGGVNFGPFFLPSLNIGGGGQGGATPAEITQIVNNENNSQTTQIAQETKIELARLAEYISCLIERPNEQISTDTIASNQEGGIYSLPPGCFAVVIQRTGAIGIGTRIQSGSGTAPNVEYWGWYAIGRTGNYGVRENLSYQDTIVFVPERANEIIINPTFKNRFTAIALISSNSCTFEE